MSGEEYSELVPGHQAELFEREVEATLLDGAAFNAEARNMLATTRTQVAEIQLRGTREQARLNREIEKKLDILDRTIAADLEE